MIRLNPRLPWVCRARLAIALVGLTSCLGALEPEVGPLGRPVCVNEDTDPNHDVRFGEEILAGIIERATVGCNKCHDPSRAGAIGFSLGGLDLTSHAALLRGGANSGTDIVMAGRPCDSVLYLKITETVPFGGRMPGNGPPFLNELDQNLIHDWIAEGARAD